MLKSIFKFGFYAVLLIAIVTVFKGLSLNNSDGSDESSNKSYLEVLDELNVKDTDLSAVHNDEVDEDLLRYATYKRHIDGDTGVYEVYNPSTGEFEEKKIRYLLIDTPETKHPKKPEQPFGKEASKRAEMLLENAEIIEIEYDVGDRTDAYDRDLAYIYADGEMLQSILVEEGLAVVDYVYPPNDKYASKLTQKEESAKEQSLGVWSLDGSFENFTVDDNGRAVRLK